MYHFYIIEQKLNTSDAVSDAGASTCTTLSGDSGQPFTIMIVDGI